MCESVCTFQETCQLRRLLGPQLHALNRLRPQDPASSTSRQTRPLLLQDLCQLRRLLGPSLDALTPPGSKRTLFNLQSC